MKVRDRKITVRLTDAERDHLQEEADLVYLKVESFVRNLNMESRMKPHPQEEWAELVRQNSGIATNVNQIARKVNSSDDPEAKQILRLVLDMQAQIWTKLKEF